jgi:EF hand
MKTRNLHKSAIVAAMALVLSGIAFAQSPSLTLPNNSAGTPDSIPGTTTIVIEPGVPSMTEGSLIAFEKLDANHRGYLTRSDTDRLSGHVDFDAADLNHDGRLSIDEFQRAWADYRSGGQ